MQLFLDFPLTLTQEKYMYVYLLEKITLLVVFDPSLQDLLGNSPTVCHTVPMVLALGIWYWIN